MKSVVLSGYYGYGNLGDELILKYVANLLRELGYERLIALTGNLQYSERKHKEIEFINRNDISEIQEHVKRCSFTALAGGGLFQEFDKLSADEFFKNPFNGVHSYINLPLISNIYKKPCYYLFQGVGPFFSDNGRSFAKYAYSLSHLILTRDINSSTRLSELGIKNHILSTDPVFLQIGKKKKEFNSKPKIAICLRQWIEKDFEQRMIEAFISFIDHFYKDYDFDFISFQDLSQKDSKIYEDINKGLSSNKQLPVINTDDLSLEEAEGLISNYDLIIGMRYHSILLAIKYNIPFIAINYWDKVRNIVEEVGLNDFIIEKQDLTCNRLKKIFERVIKELEQITIKIEYEKSRLFNRLQNSVSMLKDTLKDHPCASFEKAINTKNDFYLENWVRYKRYQERARDDFATNLFSQETIKRLIKDTDSRNIILYPSLITWDTIFFQRPHQILREFAKRGFKVFFLTPEPTQDKALPINQVEDNLFVINSINLLSPLKDEPIKILITWTMNIIYKSLFPNAFIIYDWLDHLEVFKEYYSPFMEIDHLKLLKSSEIVTATSNALLMDAKRVRGDVLLVPNGVRVEDFICDDTDFIPDDLLPIKTQNKPLVGYYGLFALWRFDYDLVNYLTSHMRDVNFVFIGLSDDGSQSMFQQGDNLFILPPKKYKELKNYMRYFDAGIIPYKTDRIAETIFPNKLCEFLSMGIPVVTSNLPECRRFETVLVSNNYEGFVKNLYKAIQLNKDTQYKELIKKEASANSWQSRVDVIIKAFNSVQKNQILRDTDLLEQEHSALNTTIDILITKNASLFEDFKNAIRERDNTWLQLNRVIDEKNHVFSLLEHKTIDLDRTKSDLDRTKSDLDRTKSDLDRTKSDLDKTKSDLDKTKSDLDKTKSDLDKTKSDLEQNKTNYYLLQQEYEALRKHHLAVINSKTWRFGQFVGKLIGIESRWRKAFRGLFDNNKTTTPDYATEKYKDTTHYVEPPLETKKSYHESAFRGNLYDIFIFSMIDFSFRYQRPQQLASYFAKKGHRVFYLNITQFLEMTKERDFETKEIAHNLWEVFLKCPKSLDIYGGDLDHQSVESLTNSLISLKTHFNMITVVSIVHNPFWTTLALNMKEVYNWKLIYDCLDEWETFSGIGMFVLEQERRLVKHCDILTVTADKLLKKWNEHNKNGLIVRNACDYDHFSKASVNELLNQIQRPVIGFFGGIADWIEIDYFAYAAQRHPEWSFVLLGGIFTDVSAIEKLKNVHLLGNQPYHQMRDYLYNFDVCLIPFKKNKITEAVDPVKLYEYFSLGKPVVARDLYEIRFYKDVLYLFDTADEFVEAIKSALSEASKELKQKRIQIASTNTWSDRIRQIDKAIKERTPLASIIIITYNNLEYNKLCIESIINKTDYPDYEVIIIDNDSSDGTKDYLKNIKDKRITVILNDKNEGFARANNRGLKEARGQYLVFLNNDTIVTKGWLTKMINYLDRYQDIGMIGPVTNFCGNEAKIDLPYTDIKDMDYCAYEYTTKHEGKFFDIHMLALYCAGLRRDTFERVGFLDENFGIGMFEDDDYSHRIKLLGLRVVCAEDIFVHHFGQGAFKKLIDDGSYNKLFERNREYFEKKWNIKWQPHVHRD